MFSAAFLITAAEGADKQALYDELEIRAQALSDVFVIGWTAPVVMYQAGDIILEIGYPDQDAWEESKKQAAWAELKDLTADEARVATCQYAAYGDGEATVTDTENAKCHRLMFNRLLDGADPETVAHFEAGMPHMQDYIRGFVNSKLSHVVESDGPTGGWDYVVQCDFEDMDAYGDPYVWHPIHLCYVDRFYEPACEECIMDPDLCTGAIEVDGPFLANYLD